MDYLVAQKLHAASDPDEDGYENQRVHDILDLLAVEKAFYPGAPLSLKAACVDIFDYRAGEAHRLGRTSRRWPPVFRANDYWRAAYPALSESLGVSLPLEEAVAAVETWVAEIDAC
ncbi:MAG: hypothetical protein LBJ02_11560 [Bifidobacteriaceae bacterium]|nr:hypothetical protein [Bifidobacteriaceae bacterium]